MPRRLAPIVGVVSVACAPPATPSETPAAQQEPPARHAAEPDGAASGAARHSGLSLGASPEEFRQACSPKMGISTVIRSNRESIVCTDSPSVLPHVLAIVCGSANDEESVCALSRTSEPLSPNDAATLFETLRTELSAEYGSARQATDSEVEWKSPGVRTLLTVEQAEQGSEVKVVRATTLGAVLIAIDAPEFPERVAGFRFGASLPEVQRACEASGGTFASDEAAPDIAGTDLAPSFACDRPDTDIPFDVHRVAGTFCASALCEIRVLVAEDARQVRPVLEDEFGAPVVTDGDPSETCKTTGPQYAWLWTAAVTEGASQVRGAIRLTDSCQTMLAYDNAAGWRLRYQAAEGVR